MRINRLLVSTALLVVALAPGQAANITVGYQNYNPVYQSDATTLLPTNSLVWYGSWSVGADVPGLLSGYLGGTKTLSEVSAQFTLGATRTYGDFGDGSEAYSIVISDVGLLGKPIDMVFWNSASASTATETAAFRWSLAAFPDGASLDTEVNVANALPSLDPDIAVSVLYGTATDSGTDGLGTITTIPEPSSIALLLCGSVLLASQRLSTNKKKSV